MKTLQRFGGTEGKPLKTTIDPKVQAAAGKALTDVKKPASMVALRPSTGEILAVANKPGGYNRALMGQYPPGSTFKVVTAAALVAGGMGAGTKVGCPATTTIGGRSFHNYKHEDFGTVPLREAFAHSCNTTFARLAVDKLGRSGSPRSRPSSASTRRSSRDCPPSAPRSRTPRTTPRSPRRPSARARC